MGPSRTMVCTSRAIFIDRPAKFRKSHAQDLVIHLALTQIIIKRFDS